PALPPRPRCRGVGSRPFPAHGPCLPRPAARGAGPDRAGDHGRLRRAGRRGVAGRWADGPRAAGDAGRPDRHRGGQRGRGPGVGHGRAADQADPRRVRRRPLRAGHHGRVAGGDDRVRRLVRMGLVGALRAGDWGRAGLRPVVQAVVVELVAIPGGAAVAADLGVCRALRVRGAVAAALRAGGAGGGRGSPGAVAAGRGDRPRRWGPQPLQPARGAPRVAKLLGGDAERAAAGLGAGTGAGGAAGDRLGGGGGGGGAGRGGRRAGGLAAPVGRAGLLPVRGGQHGADGARLGAGGAGL
ncbi:MAG: hypothetical protein AVDCRST_MAG73-4113, partial [uncultured Thermomicrobiales bacterium]